MSDFSPPPRPTREQVEAAYLLDDVDPDVEEVRVIRSKLDSAVWVAIPFGIPDDQSWAESPGGLRAVQGYAAARWAPGRAVRWRRLNPDTYVMEEANRG